MTSNADSIRLNMRLTESPTYHRKNTPPKSQKMQCYQKRAAAMPNDKLRHGGE